MQKKTKDNQFIKKPVYPGGLKAMRQFIHKEMKYPKKALDSKIEGTVYLKYEVGHKGKVTKTKVLSSLGYGCDEEAQRLVSLLKFEIAKNPRKLKIKFNKTIKINFRIPKAKPIQPKVVPRKVAPVKQTIKYTVTQTTPKPKKEQEVKTSGYSYIIKY